MPGIDMYHSAGRTSSNDGVLPTTTDGKRVNGVVNGSASLERAGQGKDLRDDSERLTGLFRDIPPDIIHISHGYVPFTCLINRVTQQCWNDLSDLLTSLGNSHPAGISGSAAEANNVLSSKAGGSQSDELARRKLMVLEFCQAKRADFIKLLVLSNWSRQAAEVSRLVDLQAFIRMRYEAYNDVVAVTAAMNHDLIRAQIATPDLKTSLEVLASKQPGMAQMVQLGFSHPPPLRPQRTLQILRKINRIIRSRLILRDAIPDAFAANYRVCDGRVRFTSPSEFQVDLSIGEEAPSSQFFFVDLKFLFSPTINIARRGLLSTLEQKANLALMDSGIPGCYNFLHNLILTLKLTILFKQAVHLSQNHWRDTLQVDMLHRTLVVQYWVNQGSPKSWIEIGISKKAPRTSDHRHSHQAVPFLCLRWVRDGVEASTENVCFSQDSLSMEAILYSITSLHISHVLLSTFNLLRECRLYALSQLDTCVRTSTVEPGECCLDLHVTKQRRLRITIDSVTGSTVARTVPPLVDHRDNNQESGKHGSADLLLRISRLRELAVKQEVESYLRFAGWAVIESQRIRANDIRHFFPHSSSQLVLFSRHKSWHRDWAVAFTSSMDGDEWWIVHLRSEHPLLGSGNQSPVVGPLSLKAVHRVKSDTQAALGSLSPTYFAELANSLSAMVEAEANGAFLTELYAGEQTVSGSLRFQVSHKLRAPTMTIRFRRDEIPPALRLWHPASPVPDHFIREKVRLSFHGIDSTSACAIVVAKGQLETPLRHSSRFTRETQREVSFSADGVWFTMHFLVPVGHAVIVPLFVRLQQLEAVLSSLESLKARKFLVLGASLSQVDFAYGKFPCMRARIKFRCRALSESRDFDGSLLALTKLPLFRLLMGIRFPSTNPHRRIRESLVDTLNSPQGGFKVTLGLLTATTSLLMALEQICCRAQPHPSPDTSARVTAYGAKLYRIWYPAVQGHFYLSLGRRKGRVMWILRNSSVFADSERQSATRPLLAERLYNHKGDGWSGLSHGAAAEIHKVQHLIDSLDHLVRDSVNGATAGADLSAQKGAKQESQSTSRKSNDARDHAEDSVILID